MKMELAKFAAIVAGADCEHPLAGGRVQSSFHGCGYRLFVDTVDHDFVGAVGTVDQLRLHSTAERGAIGVAALLPILP